MNRKLILPFLVALAICWSGVSAEPFDKGATAPQAPSISRFADAEEAVGAYRSGWTEAVRLLSSERGADTSPRLREILDAVVPLVAWGHVLSDDRIFSLTPGERNGVWVVVMDPDHPSLKTPAATLVTGVHGGLTVVSVRPDRMSARWAGIFLFHEMSHALDDMHDPDKSGCSREFDAYRVEREVFDRITSGAFGRALDAAIAERGYAGNDDILRDIARPERPEVSKIVVELGDATHEAPALSQAELEMRDGFYVVSLADRIGEAHGVAVAQRCKDMAAVINAASKY